MGSRDGAWWEEGVGFDATDTSFEIVRRKEKKSEKWEERHKRLEKEENDEKERGYKDCGIEE